MYSPKIKDHLISKLYDEAKKQQIPMTKMVNDIIEKYVAEVEENGNGIQSDNSQRHNPDSLGKGKKRAEES